jgi:hypothetical protein
MTNHWLLRIGDTEHFKSSMNMRIWGVKTTDPCVRGFLRCVQPGDYLWFIKSGSNGLVFAVATYLSHQNRIIGPLLALTPTDEELGWIHKEGHEESWDVQVNYSDLIMLHEYGLFTNIKSPLCIRKYNDKCAIDLPNEINAIERYLRRKPTKIK